MPEPLLTSNDIRSAFAQPLPRVRLTAAYGLRLLGVLLGLLLLQLLYIALIVGLIGLTAWYLIAATALFDLSISWIAVILYLAPPLAGLITVLFLLKPILVRPPQPPEPLMLSPSDEPVLFEFVEHLCRSIGAPRPSRIYADLQVNAAASVRGWRSFFTGDLSLTIGLPLAHSFTLPQFAGVLAHEFGHFAQRVGLRSHYLIQTIQHWFARVVHQRDGWDVWLEEIRRHRDGRLQMVGHLAALVVAGSRKYLALLMRGGQWLSCSFSRQMEYDADRYEVALAGPDVFEQTVRQLPVLQFGAALAWNDTERDWALGRLPADLPALIATRLAGMPQDVTDGIIQADLGRPTGRWDTHPSTCDRIASVRLSKAAGMFPLDGPASRLFRDLAALQRDASLHHYRRALGSRADSASMVSAEDVALSARNTREFDDAATQLLNALPAFYVRWFRLPIEPPQDLEVLASDPPSVDADAVDNAFSTHLLHFAALKLENAGVKADRVAFRMPGVLAVDGHLKISSGNLATILAGHRELTQPVAKRIETAIACLVAGTWGVHVDADRTARLPDPLVAWQAYGALSLLQDRVHEVRKLNVAASIVRANSSAFPAARCANLLDGLAGQAISAIKEILADIPEIPSPVILDYRTASTVAAQLAPTENTLSEQIPMFLQRVDTLAAQTLSQLAWLTIRATPPISE